MVRESSVLSLAESGFAGYPQPNTCSLPWHLGEKREVALCRRGGGVDTGSCSTGPRVCSSQWAIEGSHKVFYCRPMKNERIIYFILTCLGFFFLLSLFTKQQQERKCRRQMSQAPVFRSEGKRETGLNRYCRLAPGLCPSILSTGPKALEGADRARVGGRGETTLSAGQQPCPSGGHPGLCVWRLGLQSLGPDRGRRREGSAKKGCEFYQGSPGTMGPRWAGAVRMLPACPLVSFFRRVSSSFSSFDVHELVHHIPILPGQHGGHS